MFDAGRQLITVPRRRVKPLYPAKTDTRPKWGSMSEDEMREAWIIDAIAARKRIRDRDSFQPGEKQNRSSSANGSQAKILACLATDVWMTKPQIIAATGLGANAVQNGITALVTKGYVRKRKETIDGAHRALWQRKSGKDDPTILPTRQERLAASLDAVAAHLTGEWQTRAQIETTSAHKDRVLLKHLGRLVKAGRAERKVEPRPDRGGMVGYWRLVK